jgi:MoaA/NifB/PqqE/SkfB family radical SAM enzyme
MRTVHGTSARLLRLLMALDVVRVAVGRYRNPVRALKLVGRFARLVASLRGDRPTARFMSAGGRWFTHLHAPGWPSAAFRRHVLAELEALEGPGAGGAPSRPAPRLQSIIFAVTKSCDLRCRHCCEWRQINRDETLSARDITTIVRRFQDLGVTQVHFSGGEPLHRLDDILAAVRAAGRATDFWLFTSGVGLDHQVARRLRDGGLRGVNISLDHWQPRQHDAFRGRPGTFAAAVEAADAVCQAGLALCLTLCPTREFVSEANLQKYAALAAELEAGFIQILEPRQVGRFAGQDVALNRRQQAVLDRFFTAMNGDAALAHMPAVIYPAFDQRRLGCLGAGWRYAYVDTDGLIHPCPFCRGAVGNALDEDFAEHLARLRRQGCAAHGQAEGLSRPGRLTGLVLEGGGQA